MKKRLLLLLFSLIGVPPVAANIGVNLLWDDCALGGGRVVNHDACDVARTLIVSVVTDQLLEQINGAQGYIHVSFDSGDIPDYWRVDASGCRSGQLTADATIDPAVAAEWYIMNCSSWADPRVAQGARSAAASSTGRRA